MFGPATLEEEALEVLGGVGLDEPRGMERSNSTAPRSAVSKG